MNTTANKITIFRIVLIPVFLVLAYTGLKYWALAVYIIACLSDVADGYIARHYNQVSNFGKFVDPLADKMLVLSAMCFFIENGQMPGWAVAIVLFRGVRSAAHRRGAEPRHRRRALRQDKNRLHDGRPRRDAGVRPAVPRGQPCVLYSHHRHNRLFRRGILCRKPRRFQSSFLTCFGRTYEAL